MKKFLIDKDAVAANLRTIRSVCGATPLIADLSANAYGLGLMETARILREEGVKDFAVSDAEDAAALRNAGFTEERLMMLRSTADQEELEKLVELGVVCTVGSYDAAVALNGVAEARKTVCEIQLKLDTGLGRYGFSVEETERIISLYKFMSNLAVVGLFTTLCPASGKKAMLSQIEQLRGVADKLRAAGYETGTVHACDAANVLIHSLPASGFVRVGSELFGRLGGRGRRQLENVGFLSAGIEEISWFPKGHHIEGAGELKAPAKLAVISVGTCHGFGIGPQETSGSLLSYFRLRRKGRFVRVNGQKARVVGKIGLLHTVLDVSRISCSVGDKVLLDVSPLYAREVPRVYSTGSVPEVKG